MNNGKDKWKIWLFDCIIPLAALIFGIGCMLQTHRINNAMDTIAELKKEVTEMETIITNYQRELVIIRNVLHTLESGYVFTGK